VGDLASSPAEIRVRSLFSEMGLGALFFSIVAWFIVFEIVSFLLFEVLALVEVVASGFVYIEFDLAFRISDFHISRQF
jgi:hypothetical protein